uniref:PH domain-containing protein n=1 Tax=Monodelphis domestica TaxID=13616 RepID=F7GHK2_MONDO
MALVKAGWLWRQSTILRRWKRNWFVLWMDGTLGYYKDDSLQEEEERVLIRYNCREVKTGEECPEMQLPEGQTRDGLLIVFLRDGPRLTLCADSKDEALCASMIPTTTITRLCHPMPMMPPTSALGLHMELQE